jgi:hypothetical protein
LHIFWESSKVALAGKIKNTCSVTRSTERERRTKKESSMKRFLMAGGVFLALVLVCAGAFAAPQPAGAAPVAQAGAAGEAGISGKVVETMNAGSYTYVLIEKNGKKQWLAIPLAPVKVGQELKFQPGADMGRFTSKSLNRTFDDIIFSGGLMTPGAGAQAPHPVAAASTEKIKVEKASGPDAYTVSEIHEKKAALNEKTAVVKGKVVKVSEGIMGKNWIHLQDGTGDAFRATNKLVVTSQDLPAVGDIVTMKGTIYNDKDFGSGYHYTVIMENASIQR